ncbi:helix-turn-helix domain-containing protein [Spirosoma sp. KNUC1025]|uniref:AraC family transcriptional regulator n=1 Tax=Spirosoma sp. KNUC1025 TaxID=2894082 RepID=UPI001E48C4C5|nr:helix-turn-helix domain-containing protein [Spirosoma sp. KNUC1025]UFH57692.1 helix-turn-helix domain-containing protein [Spirosoma sp. KNUC1025]
MPSSNSLPEDFSQNNQLPIRIVSPNFGHVSPKARENYGPTHRLRYYFLLFVLEGSTHYGIDGETIEVGKYELLFALPHQIQQVAFALHETNYYKLGFDDECLSRLPRQYPFLLNPLNQQKIRFSPTAASRLQAIFAMLQGLLTASDTDPELILAHLYSLLTEINAAYFAGKRKPADDRLAKYIGFKVFVENNLTHHPAIKDIAQELALSTDSLYQLVKQYSGLSPKEFVTNRLILEARRRLYYGERSSVKELAFELGFNDPDYFSRLFKKATGKTVAEFFQDLS